MNTRANEGTEVTLNPTVRRGEGKSFGTFGELLQGVLPNNRNFLVTFPIELYSTAIFTSDPQQAAVTVSPSYKQKARRLAVLILQHFQLPLGGELQIESEIPVGKGLASSSADLVAAARAVADCYGLSLSPELLQSLMREIEPSDGVMYPGVVSFYHRDVAFREFLGTLDPMTVVAIDEGGMVDTFEFNKIKPRFNCDEKQEYAELLAGIEEGIRTGDNRQIGRIATRSAILNQKMIAKHTLAAMQQICAEVDGLGVITAHSGTCIGILLVKKDPRYFVQLQEVSARLEKQFGPVNLYHSWGGF